MDKRDAPPVDDNDPASTATELNPEKIDLQKKPRSKSTDRTSESDFRPEQMPRDMPEAK